MASPSKAVEQPEAPKKEAEPAAVVAASVECSMTEREKEYFQTFITAPTQSTCSTAFSSPVDPKD